MHIHVFGPCKMSRTGADWQWLFYICLLIPASLLQLLTALNPILLLSQLLKAISLYKFSVSIYIYPSVLDH